MHNEPQKTWPDRNDDKLRSLLPSNDCPYDFYSLSQAETVALEEAFSDAFGYPLEGSQLLPLPPGIESGLLQHSFYSRNLLEENQDPDVFWHVDGSSDECPPYLLLPLDFIPRRLQIYFDNQLDRFYCKMLIEQPEYASMKRSRVESLAFRRPYTKPWYEFHAIQLFDSIDRILPMRAKATCLGGHAYLVSCLAGRLGRLMEQYYWRFRFERAAITGIGARRGASAGGRAKSSIYQREHFAWQNAALAIWERRPGLSKIAVAERIRKRSRIPRTAKHIARYISRPRVKSSRGPDYPREIMGRRRAY